MQGRRSPGDLIPGFDCKTGTAVGYIREEWETLTKGLTITHRECYLVASDSNGSIIYEIYNGQEATHGFLPRR